MKFLLFYHFSRERPSSNNERIKEVIMYHGRFKKSHYEAVYNWGRLLYNHGKIISNNHTFTITQERKEFAEKCLPIYEKYYPEVLEETVISLHL